MKGKIKKIMSLLTSVILVLGAAAVPIFADEIGPPVEKELETAEEKTELTTVESIPEVKKIENEIVEEKTSESDNEENVKIPSEIKTEKNICKKSIVEKKKTNPEYIKGKIEQGEIDIPEDIIIAEDHICPGPDFPRFIRVENEVIQKVIIDKEATKYIEDIYLDEYLTPDDRYWVYVFDDSSLVGKQFKVRFNTDEYKYLIIYTIKEPIQLHVNYNGATDKNGNLQKNLSERYDRPDFANEKCYTFNGEKIINPPKGMKLSGVIINGKRPILIFLTLS